MNAYNHTFKQKSLALLLFCSFFFAGYAQEAMIPSIIVFPDNTWMFKHDYMDIHGKQKVPNYKKAFDENTQIKQVLSAIQSVLQERGFETQDLEEIIESNYDDEAMELAESDDEDYAAEVGNVENLLRQAKPDIRLNVAYEVDPQGAFKNISLLIKAVDAFSKTPLPGAINEDIPMTKDPVGLAVRKQFNAKCEEFCDGIIAYFKDLRDHGRRIEVVFKAQKDSGIDLLNGTTTDGTRISTFLFNWVRSHAKEQAAKKNSSQQTKSLCGFKDVRIEFFNDDGEPTDAIEWGEALSDELANVTGFNVNFDQGNTMGKVTFIVGR